VPYTKKDADFTAFVDAGIIGQSVPSDRLGQSHFSNISQFTAPDGEGRCAVFENLEPRILMSATDPAIGSQIVDMQWDGIATQVIANEWVVRFDGPEAKVDPLMTSLLEYGFDDAEMRSLGGNGFGIIRADGADYESLSAWVALQTDVLYIEPNFVHAMGDTVESTTPDDSSFSWLWGMNNTGQTGGTVDADIDAVEAWDLTTGSSDIVIAVIDTGIDYTHPDLAGNMWTNSGEIAGDGIDNDGNGYIDDVYGYDFAYGDGDPMDGNSHGTHTAGTIGAVGDNDSGVVGVNWNVSIMALKFLNDSGSGTTGAAIQAINYVTMMKRDYGVNIVATNNSWGGGGYSSALADAIAASGQQDILFIAAAGNDGEDNDSGGHYPSNYTSDNVISVAATDRNDNLASFSNYGETTVDLGAPGVSIYSTTAGGNYASYSGTSMATPHVTGVVALLAAQNPEATMAEIKAAILNGADSIASLDGKTVTGARLNAYNSLQLIGNGEDVTGPSVTSVSPSGQSGPTDTITVEFSEELLAESVTTSSFIVRGSGADGVFDTGDDSIVNIVAVSQDQGDQVTLDLGADLGLDHYRLTVVGIGANAIQDLEGNSLNDGLNTIALFEIISVVVSAEPDDVLGQAADSELQTGDSVMFSGFIGDGAYADEDVDIVAIDADAGTIILATINAGGSGSDLDSVLRLFDSDGNELTFNDDFNGLDSRIEFAIGAAGTYYVAVSGFDNFSYNPLSGGSGDAGSTGSYLLNLSLTSAGDNNGPIVGPDEVGYVASSGIFGFEDISSFGTVGLSYGDDRYFAIESESLSDFDFDFYGSGQGDIYVSSNGIITFGDSNTAWANSNLTVSPTQSAIVPLWDDLVVDGGGSIVWSIRGSGDQQRLVIQWDQVRFYGSSDGTVTFQAILYEADGSIRFNYADLDGNSSHDEGASASVGIRNAGEQSVGESLLQISINDGQNNFVGTGKSVVIATNAAPELELNDQTMSHQTESIVVNLSGTDADGDTITYSVSASLTESHRIQERIDLQIHISRRDNYRGWGEKYAQGASGAWFYILANGDVYRWNGVESPTGNTLEGTVDVSYYASMQSLINLDVSGSAAVLDGVVSLSGDVLTITPQDGFAGSFEVYVTASDGIATTVENFTMTVTNEAPILSIADQTMSHQSESLDINLSATDADGDPLTYSVSVSASESHSLQGRIEVQRHIARRDNYRGWGEKYLQGASGAWFYVLANGDLYRWNSVESPTGNSLEGTVDVSYYADLQSLINLDVAGSVAAIEGVASISGDVLTITPQDGYAGSFYVHVTASDGIVDTVASFNMTVTNEAPILSIADQTMSHQAESLDINLSATDADGGTITYSVSLSPSEAHSIQERIGVQMHNSRRDNHRGWGEKYVQGASGSWFYILANGDVYRWNYVESATGNILEGTVDTSFYSNLQSLIDLDVSDSGGLDGIVSVSGDVLTITPPDGFAGSFDVYVTASDGVVDVVESFSVTVTNEAPTLSIDDQSMSYQQDPLDINLSADDTDGDTITYSASVSPSVSHSIQERIDLQMHLARRDNHRGWGEKYILGDSGAWFYILGNGDVYRWNCVESATGNILEGTVDASYYANPQALIDLDVSGSGEFDGVVSVSGDVLTITPPDGFAGSFEVSVTAADGVESVVETFTVTIAEQVEVAGDLEDADVLGEAEALYSLV
jgi:subtilisin family serine protease